MTRRRLPLVLALLLGSVGGSGSAGCAMRSGEPEARTEPTQTTTVSVGNEAPRTRSESDEAPAMEAPAMEVASEAPPPSAPSSPGGAGSRVPQTTTVETVQVGSATSDSDRTITGNTSAGNAWARLVDTEDSLHDALGLASVDCDSARELRDRICELGNRICTIANEHPDDRVTEDRCEDGQDRCERARRRVDDRCD